MFIHRWRLTEHTSMKKNFDFVNVTTPNDRSNPEYRRQVHVQAMRSFRRQQRLANVEAYERSTRGAATTREEQMDEQSAMSIVPNQGSYITSCATDPFDALPIGFGEHRDLLLFFQTRIGPMLLPEDERVPGSSWSTQWLNTALQYPIMLAASCCHAAVFLDDVQGKQGQSPRTLELQTRTMRSLNESLENGVGDEAIGTVMMFAANCIVTGQADEMRMHMLALDRMVAMRGGRENLSDDPVLQMGVLWHLGAFCALTKHEAQVGILDIPRVPAVDTRHQLSSLLAKCGELTRARHELESTREIDKLRLRQFSDQRSVLECQLGQMRYELQDEPHVRADLSHMLSRAVCLAALFYAFFYLRRFMMGGPLTDDLINELVDILARTEELIFDPDSQTSVEDREAALWSATIASRFAQSSVKLRFTQRYAMKLALLLDCTIKDQWIERLRHFVWPDQAWDTTINDLMGDLPP